jgi:hypothetical protein
MRTLILKRIKEIKEIEMNFSASTMRWQNFKIANQHISSIDFELLSDEHLVHMFEQILFRYYKQM